MQEENSILESGVNCDRYLSTKIIREITYDWGKLLFLMIAFCSSERKQRNEANCGGYLPTKIKRTGQGAIYLRIKIQIYLTN